MLTVVTPAPHHRMTTVEAVVAECPAAAAIDDTQLTAIIEQVSAVIAASSGRTFARETLRETVTPARPPARLMLTRWPIVEVLAVTIDGDPIATTGVEAEHGGFLYRVDANGYRCGWPSGRIVVDYRAGYSLPEDPAPTMPADLQRAATLQCAAWIVERGRDAGVKREEIPGVVSREYFFQTRGALTPEVEALIAPYRVIGACFTE
jgi:hypothetical protein